MRRRRQAVFKWNVFNVVCIVIFSSSLHLVNYLRLWKGVKNRPAITFINQTTNVEVRNSLITAEFNTIMCHEKHDTYKYPSSRSNRIAILLMSNVVLNRSNIQFEVLKESWKLIWQNNKVSFGKTVVWTIYINCLSFSLALFSRLIGSEKAIWTKLLFLRSEEITKTDFGRKIMQIDLQFFFKKINCFLSLQSILVRKFLEFSKNFDWDLRNNTFLIWSCYRFNALHFTFVFSRTYLW